jgi:hypothetical protein
MRAKGRPVLGAIAGFFFGLALSLVLLTSGAMALDNVMLAVFPLLFLVLGLVWGLWAPLARNRGPAAASGPPLAGRSGFAGGTVAGPLEQGADQSGGGTGAI